MGVVMIGLFLSWQHNLEKIHNDPESPYSVLTPPPLMRLSLWTRANGRIAAMMMIAFTNWCAFLAWNFWVMVRLFFAGIISLRVEILICDIALFPELQGLHGDGDRHPSPTYVRIGDTLQPNGRLDG
jgi:hypothetical protein